MRRAPARAIQALAGDQDLSTTQMHLSPAALDAAIRLLDGAADNVEQSWRRRNARPNDARADAAHAANGALTVQWVP